MKVVITDGELYSFFLLFLLKNLTFEKIQLLIIAYRLTQNELLNLQLVALLSLYCFASCLFEL